MKKLMFAIAAVAAGTVLADVTSANIVGYSTITTEANVNDIHGAPFLNIGQDDLDVQDIVLDNGSDGQDILKVFNAATGIYENYNWFSTIYDPSDNYKPLGPGWGASYMYKAGVIKRGQGFWLKTIKANNVKISGEVAAANANTLNTEANVNDIVACMYPVELDVQDIVLDNGSDGQDILKIFNAATGIYENYNWFSTIYDPSDNYKPLGPGWGASYMYKAGTILPGQGFWLKTIKANTVTIKSPL